MKSNLIALMSTILFFFFSPGEALRANSSDNIYGDYLISTSKKKISMDLEGANLVDVLKVLSQETGLNFVSSEAVRDRKITLYLDNVPLKEALDVIFKANNLIYEFYPESNIFIVKEMGKPTIELKTKVYQLKYARVKSSRLYKEIGDAMKRETTTTEGGGEATEEGGAEEEEGILEAVKKVLSEYGRAVEESRTNSLVVTDLPSQFPIIDKVVESLDKPLPQVMIEVEMLDVKKDLVDKLGVKFPFVIYGAFTGGSRTTSFPFLSNSTPSIREVTSSEGTPLFPKSAVSLGVLDLSKFQAILEFFSQDQSTKYLARPKILTLSGETAEIKLSTEEAVSVKRTEDPETKEVTYEIERAETGTILRVTPQINLERREITMLVEPKVALAEDSGYLLENFVVKDVHNRSSKSVVRLKDSQTLMIGGLLRNDNSTTKYKIPFLGDIPLLGALFRHKYKSSEERELLVFLTPHIISGEKSDFKFKSILREQREQTDSYRFSAIEEALAKFE